MTLRDYSYLLLEEIRNAHIVDDERIDLRFLDTLIGIKREKVLSKDNSTSAHNETLRQTMWVDMELDSLGHNPSILQSEELLPTFIENKYGPLIDEIRGTNHMAPHFTVVPFDRIRWCGNGYFNKNNIFASVHGKRVYLKSKDDAFRLIERIKIEGVFSNPMEVLDANGDPQLTPTTGTYPLNGDIFESVKSLINKEDIAFMLRLPSDEVNDATGNITLD